LGLSLGSEIGLPDPGDSHWPLRDLAMCFKKLTLALAFSVFSGQNHTQACQTSPSKSF
jgi:hypothetical protein